MEGIEGLENLKVSKMLILNLLRFKNLNSFMLHTRIYLPTPSQQMTFRHIQHSDI
jgi:hypothetical protein